MIDLNNFAKSMLAVTKKREENGANIKADTRSMLKHTATEVVEAMEAYTKWCFTGKEQVPTAFSSELADIIACVLITCANEGINIEAALAECLKKNEARAEGKGDKL